MEIRPYVIIGRKRKEVKVIGIRKIAVFYNYLSVALIKAVL
jgi:hypothetical protein